MAVSGHQLWGGGPWPLLIAVKNLDNLECRNEIHVFNTRISGNCSLRRESKLSLKSRIFVPWWAARRSQPIYQILVRLWKLCHVPKRLESAGIAASLANYAVHNSAHRWPIRLDCWYHRLHVHCRRNSWLFVGTSSHQFRRFRRLICPKLARTNQVPLKEQISGIQKERFSCDLSRVRCAPAPRLTTLTMLVIIPALFVFANVSNKILVDLIKVNENIFRPQFTCPLDPPP